MSSRERKPLREPTQQDFESYRGGHTFKKWAGLPSDWHCPACKRSKFQLLTWTKSLTGYGGTIRGQYQWLAPIQEHHDHHSDGGAHSPRFCATLICSDCNTADGKVKRLLNCPRLFLQSRRARPDNNRLCALWGRRSLAIARNTTTVCSSCKMCRPWRRQPAEHTSFIAPPH